MRSLKISGLQEDFTVSTTLVFGSLIFLLLNWTHSSDFATVYTALIWGGIVLPYYLYWCYRYCNIRINLR